MAGVPGDSSHHGIVDSSPYRFSHDSLGEVDRTGSTWYLSRRELDEISPSRRDGIDPKKETYFRKSYCTFLQDLGMRLKVPQVTIATAIIFSHRFFLRQSHAKNDRRTIATVCMFLAGKVEETPRPLKDVILVSYEIIHKKDPAAVQRIKQREVYEQQKELILLGERVVLATLGFDLNVHHPYKPLVEAIKKFKVAQNALAQVAWNFVNDGLRTSLCLQFKPHHIAAGAIFLAAKFLKVKLPSDGEKVWWQEFDVTPRQLEEVSNQMLELYEQNRAVPPAHGNEVEGGPASTRPSVKGPVAYEEPSLLNGSQRTAQNGCNDLEVKEPKGEFLDSKTEGGFKDRRHHEPGNVPETNSRSNYGSDRPVKEDPGGRFNYGSQRPVKEDHGGRSNYGSERPVKEESEVGTITPGGTAESKNRSSGHSEGPKGHSPMDAIGKIDRDKVKAALEKRRKSRAGVDRKMDIMDDDDLIERELESGIEMTAEDESSKQETPSGSDPYWQEPQNIDHEDEKGYGGTENVSAEEGELSLEPHGFQYLESSGRKRKTVSPGNPSGVKDGFDHLHYHAPLSKHRESVDDSREGRQDRGDSRGYKRHRQENQG